MSMLGLDPLAIVNTPPKQDEQAVPSPNMSTPAQSGVNGMNTTGMMSSNTPTQSLGVTPQAEQQPISYEPIRTETTQTNDPAQYQQQQARLDALIASGKDPSQFDINGNPLGLYGGQVSAQQFVGSISKPREENQQYYSPDDYINLLKQDSLGSTEYRGDTVVNYNAVPEGGFGSFITAGGGDLGFSINQQGLTKEQAKVIFNNYTKEVGGKLQIDNNLGVGGIGAKGDMVQRDDGTWTFKFDDPSLLNQFGDVVGALSMAALTYATGTALLPAATAATSATGLSGTFAAGTAKAVSSAVAQQIVSGEIDPTKVVLAGLGGALEAAETADTAAGIEAAQAYDMYGEYSVEYANAMAAANEAQSTYEILNHAQTAIDIDKAINDKNVLQAIDLTESLMDSSALYTSIQDNFVGVIPDEYVTRATNAVIEAGDELIKGGDAGAVVQSLTNNILIETVATPDALANRFGLSGEGWDNTAAQTLSELTIKVLEGGNKEDILKAGFTTFLDNLPEDENQTPEFLNNIEKYWQDNIEKPLQQWWQDIEPLREEYERAGQAAVDFVKGVGEDVNNTIDTVIRAAPTTKEDWNEAEDWYHENIEDPLEETFSSGEDDEPPESGSSGFSGLDLNLALGSYAGSYAGAQALPGLENPLIAPDGELTQYESLDNNLLQKMVI